MKQSIKPHIALIAANLFFGLNYSYSKEIVPDYISPVALTLLRIATAAILFIVVLFFVKREKIDKKDYFKIFIAAMLGLVLNQLLFLKGLSMTTPIDSALIATTGPVIVLVISSLFGIDKITPMKMSGIIIGAMGALMIIMYEGMSNIGSGRLSGNLIVLGSCICYSSYLVWMKPLMNKYGAFTFMSLMFTMALIVVFPFSISQLVSTDCSALTPSIWWAVVFVLLFATFGAYFCIGYSLKGVKPTTVSIYTYSQPIIASFFALFRGQDKLTFSKIVAAILVFAGVYLVTQSYRFEKKDK